MTTARLTEDTQDVLASSNLIGYLSIPFRERLLFRAVYRDRGIINHVDDISELMCVFPRQDVDEPSSEARGSDMVNPGKDVLPEEEQPTNQRTVCVESGVSVSGGQRCTRARIR